jgi:hypothetical protein
MATRAPDTLTPATAWTARAACADDDPEMYFDERYLPSNLSCGRCPLAAECLDLAMKAEGTTAASMRFGVYGGLSTTERAVLARRRVRQPAIAPRPATRVSSYGPTPTAPCGTRAAYKRHLRHGEPPCEACRTAEARDRAERKQRPGAAA